MTVIRIDDYGEGIQAIVFDRPDSLHNFMDLEVVAELHDAVRNLSADHTVKGIVIASAKKSFVVGGDLNELKALKTPEEAVRMERHTYTQEGEREVCVCRRMHAWML